MMKRRAAKAVALCALAGLWLAASIAAQEAPVEPLIHAHAHNDYLHTRPLLDALDNGFCSVEADIWLVNGRLLVAHDRDKVKPDRTLESLYLNPLRARIKARGGRVYGTEPEFNLLIDIKSDAAATFDALERALARYEDIVATYAGGLESRRPVVAILTGNRSLEAVRTRKVRHVMFDGEMEALDRPAEPGVIRWVSANWSKRFKWLGAGSIPPEERARLKQMADAAHQRGYRLRFWGTLDVPALWAEQRAAGVDLINADNLPAARRFLLAQPP